MYFIGFRMKRDFTYSWNGIDGSHKVRNFFEGLTTDLRKSNGSLVPVSDSVLYVEAQQTFDPHNYFTLVSSETPYSKSSVKVEGVAVVPESIAISYFLGNRPFLIPIGTKLYFFKGSWGKLNCITESGVAVDIKRFKKDLPILKL